MQEFSYALLEDDSYAVMKYEGDEAVVTIPEEYGSRKVTLLNDELFKGHPELEEVILPETLRTIGSFCFDGCVRLKGISLPRSLTEIWQYAFARSGIEVIDLPGSLVSIPPYALKGCANLTMAVLHPGTRRICGHAFEDCGNLKMVAVHKDTEVRHDAFAGCDQLDPKLRLSFTATCKCPKCAPAGARIDVHGLLKKKAGQPQQELPKADPQ